MSDVIDNVNELRRELRTAAKAGRVQLPVNTLYLRNLWDITPAVSDQEIDEAVTEALRSSQNPEVVLTLTNGTVVAHSTLPIHFELDDYLDNFTGDLSRFHNGAVELTPAAPNADGYGIVIAYRMPRGCYRAGDEAEVERFGVEVGRYVQERGRWEAAPWARTSDRQRQLG